MAFEFVSVVGIFVICGRILMNFVFRTKESSLSLLRKHLCQNEKKAYTHAEKNERDETRNKRGVKRKNRREKSRTLYVYARTGKQRVEGKERERESLQHSICRKLPFAERRFSREALQSPTHIHSHAYL